MTERTPEPYEALDHRWVASRDSAGSASRAVAQAALRTRRVWVLAGALFVVGTLVGTARYGGSGIDLAIAVIITGLLYAAGSVAVSMGVSYLQVRRTFAIRLAAGTVIESRLGEDYVRLRSPFYDLTLPFSALTSARQFGSWVVLAQLGASNGHVAHVSLFPPAELARLRTAVGTRRRPRAIVGP